MITIDFRHEDSGRLPGAISISAAPLEGEENASVFGSGQNRMIGVEAIRRNGDGSVEVAAVIVRPRELNAWPPLTPFSEPRYIQSSTALNHGRS